MKKIYFLNVDFGIKLTGIERSSLKRAFLFKNYLNILPVFITSKLNVNLQKNIQHLKKIGWMPQKCQVVNVYEHLRYHDSNDKSSSPQFLSLNVDDFEVVEMNEKHQRFRSKSGNFSMYVVWHDVEKRNINYINFYFKSKKIKCELYENNRLYVSQYFDENFYINYEDIYDFQGKVVLKRIYSLKTHLIERIEHYKNSKLYTIYKSEQELTLKWMDSYSIEKKSILIIDKNRFWSLAASQRRPQCKVISVLHSNHLCESEIHNIETGTLNSNYSALLNEFHQVDTIITLTPQQKVDIETRFKNKNNIVTIPHSVDILPEEIEFKQRNLNKIVAMCRLAPEKQVVDMVLMMSELVKDHPEMKLHIYGDGGEKNKIIEKINELKLQENITLEGYVDDISLAYQDAIFSLLTSRCEGFSLAILESLTFGVPAASYDIPYGPASMIQDEVNGILVELGDYKGMAKKISNILVDESKLKEMSLQAYKSTDRYLEHNVAKEWGKLIFSE
ncbi:glycosyltransferase [Acinetobacter rudis]|uniref:Glycosyl transferase family 1 domain-containing protein n=2 Tax=Acinetobacter rudis TaxID=632955 RepID=S3P9N3_9GAMM|nr:glycosyltransferase [Acinetobacter rudis]EPF75561.1 hypothetical protein F945_01226 [Acinetobacter rudis CIP 110305]